MIPATTTIATHHPHATIIQQQQGTQIHTTIQQLQSNQQQIHQMQHQQPLQHLHHHQQLHQQQPQHDIPIVENIVTASSTTATLPQQTISLLGLRNVQISEQPKSSPPLLSRIKYSRGKIITTQGSATNVQIIETQDSCSAQSGGTTDLADCGKYEISEIDLNNTTTSATIISDLVKYAEIDDIELPDGTKIGIGFAPSDLTEHQLQAATTNPAQIKLDGSASSLHHHHHHQLQIQNTSNTEEELGDLQDHDDATTSVEECILPDGIELQEQSLTKSYTILTTRPVKQEMAGGSNSSLLASVEGVDVSNVSADCAESNTTTYELSLSDSSLQPDDHKYVCRHCGKKYRWKSTLRRHENVECGGKEPCHPCPHCSYKAKQRGNLGVHVRKHHPDKPQLASKRGRKQ